MKALLLLAAASFAAWCADPFRPAYHFTPAKNWMNDPNGTVYYRGEYHLFYQHDPFGNTWGHMSWGHAVSSDLLHWKHLPVALAEEDGIMIFSGSVVVDHNNSSGFCSQGSCLVAIYTGHRKGNQNQSLAYSNDRGRTWTKYARNPVLDLGMADFRDPKVFWHAARSRWVMAVALPKEHKVRLYASQDLKAWTALSDFGPSGATAGLWECPDLFELPVANTNEKRWVLVVSVNPGGPAGGSAVQCFVGSFDGTRFTAEHTEPRWADYGKDFYAATSFSDMPDQRRVWIGWFSNWQYARQEPTETWRTMQTVPREVSLRSTPQGLRLTQQPVRELLSLRRPVLELKASSLAAVNARLRSFREASYEVEIDLEQDGGLVLRQGETEETRAGVDADGAALVDRSRSGQVAFHPQFAGRHAVSPGARRMRVLVDHSSVEVFFGDGEAVISDRIFPSAGSLRLAVFGSGVRSFKVWRLGLR